MAWAGLSSKIVFEPSGSPDEMDYTPNIKHWVEQPLLSGKSRMQSQGVDLQEINITVKFHALISPFKDVRAALADAAANGEVLQWVFGTGEALGDFVLTGWKEKYVWTDEQGLRIATDVDLTLKEYAGPGVAEQTGIDARKAAFANKRKAINITPLKQATLTNTANKNLSTITESSRKIKKKVSKLQQGLLSYRKFKDDVVKICGQIQHAKNAADTVIQIAKNLRNSQNLSSALSNVGVATGALGSAVGSISGQASPTQITQIAGLANDLGSTVGSMGQAAQPMQAAASWWQVSPFLR